MKEFMFNGFGMNKPEDTKVKPKKEINKKKIFKISMVVFAILVFITLIVLYDQNVTVRIFADKYIFRKYAYENDLPTISTDSNNVYSFNNEILILSQNVLTSYNKYGNEKYSLEVEISTPIFESCGNYLCLADKNGKQLYVISHGRIVWKKEIEGSISDVSINENGYVAASISDTGYKTIIELYNADGENLFHTFLSNSYAIDTCISSDNKYMAIAEANFSGTMIQSNIKIISIENAKTDSVNSVLYNHTSNDLIISINYNKNNLVCIYDNHIDVFKDGNITQISDFKNDCILFADTNDSIIQIRKSVSQLFYSEFELQITDINSLTTKTYKLSKEPKSMLVCENIVAVNFGSEALFINNNGWLIKDYASSQEIKSIVLSDGLAGIVYNNKIELLHL